jgi:hypothetical protein
MYRCWLHTFSARQLRGLLQQTTATCINSCHHAALVPCRTAGSTAARLLPDVPEKMPATLLGCRLQLQPVREARAGW